MEKYEVNKLIEENSLILKKLEKNIDFSTLDKQISKYQNLISSNDFWNDQQKAKIVLKNHEDLVKKKQEFILLKKQNEDIKELFSLTQEQDSDYLTLIDELLEFSIKLKKFKIKTLLSNDYDRLSAILEIHAGAGGTEAQDWVSILNRMYQRYFDKKGFKTKIINKLDGNEAGLKSISLKVEGDYAYGYLKSEIGVHRLVRISPFDANKRRHTSFASILVMPDQEDEPIIDIDEKDLKFDAFYSSGAGGQSVNTTMSAVRITHIPTGIVATCQNERSQIQNKQRALSVLKSKLLQLEIEKRQQEQMKLKGEQKSIEWGSQIRSYIFQPYQLVKDHRTNYESSKLDDILSGEIDDFIDTYLNMYV